MKNKYNIDFKSLKIGDILYEYDYGMYIKSYVVELPVVISNQVSWKSKNVLTGEIIDYLVTLDLLHYSPNLYDYEAYVGCKQI